MWCIIKNEKRNVILTVISFLILTSSCKYDENKMQKNKAIFESRRGEFEELIALIKQLRLKRKLHKTTFVTQEAETELKSKLEELNIISIEIANSQCEKINDIEVTLDMHGGWLSPWYTPGKFQICYMPCNHQTNKGYEYYDGYHQNIYGLGSKWMMYSDTDLF